MSPQGTDFVFPGKLGQWQEQMQAELSDDALNGVAGDCVGARVPHAGDTK
jgi:hypothetical protein